MILGGKKNDDEESGDESKGTETGSDVETLASDVLESIKSEDSEALAETLKAFVKGCMKKNMDSEY